MIFRWQCNPVQPDVPAGPVAPTTRWYQSELPPVEADEYKHVCAERDELRRQLAEAKQDAERWKQKAEQAEARRQYDSVDSYNARINAALQSFRNE